MLSSKGVFSLKIIFENLILSEENLAQQKTVEQTKEI